MYAYVTKFKTAIFSIKVTSKATMSLTLVSFEKGMDAELLLLLLFMVKVYGQR